MNIFLLSLILLTIISIVVGLIAVYLDKYQVIGNDEDLFYTRREDRSRPNSDFYDIPFTRINAHEHSDI